MTSSGFSKTGPTRKTEQFSPPSWALPIYQKFSQDLANLYNSGKGGNSYNGKRVADLSDETRQAIEGLRKNSAAFGNANLLDLINNKSNSASNLDDMAKGKLIGNNQAFKQALNNSLANTADIINAEMSGAGRYGSGANNSVLANKLGNISQAANAAQYNQDVNNMMRANSQIDTARSNRISNYLNYLNSQGNAFAKQLGGGSIIDKNNQDKINANKQQFMEQDNAGWNRLKMLQELLGGLGKFGTNTSYSSGGNQSKVGFGSIFGKILGK